MGSGDFLRAQVGIICAFSRRFARDFADQRMSDLKIPLGLNQMISKQLSNGISSTEKKGRLEAQHYSEIDVLEKGTSAQELFVILARELYACRRSRLESKSHCRRKESFRAARTLREMEPPILNPHIL
jgi:hypothetical protein